MELASHEHDFFADRETWRYGPCLEIALIGDLAPDQLRVKVSECLADSEWATRCPTIAGSRIDGRERFVVGEQLFPIPLGFLVCQTQRSCWLATYPAQYLRYLGPGSSFSRRPPDDPDRTGELLEGLVDLCLQLSGPGQLSNALILNEAEGWPTDIDGRGIYAFTWAARLSPERWLPTRDADYVRLAMR